MVLIHSVNNRINLLVGINIITNVIALPNQPVGACFELVMEMRLK